MLHRSHLNFCKSEFCVWVVWKLFQEAGNQEKEGRGVKGWTQALSFGVPLSGPAEGNSEWCDERKLMPGARWRGFLGLQKHKYL